MVGNCDAFRKLCTSPNEDGHYNLFVMLGLYVTPVWHHKEHISHNHISPWWKHIALACDLLKGRPSWQASHPSGKTLKTWNFVIYFSRPGICSKNGENLEFYSKPRKNLNFFNLMFNFSRCLYNNKKSFPSMLYQNYPTFQDFFTTTTKIIYIYVISKLSKPTL